MTPKVLILTASYGSGHVIAAKGIEEALSRKGITPDVIDLVISGGRTERNAAAFYEFLMKKGHFIWKIYHDRIMPIRRGDSIRKVYEMLHRKKFFKEIESFSPDIIVSTMDTASLVASLYKKDHPQVVTATVLTDFVVHPLWKWDNTDYYFVGCKEVKEEFVKHGAEANKIIVSGIPLRSQFNTNISKKEARKKLQVPEDKTIVLISAGSFGSVPVRDIIRVLSLHSNSFAIILAGKKEASVVVYADLLHEHGVIGKVLDFAENMEVYMRAADLYVSKAGGLTVAECLASDLPAVYVNNFPGHEIGNARYVEKHGAAIVIKSKKELGVILGGLLQNTNQLQEMSNNAKKIAFSHASDELVKHLLS